MSSTAVAQMSTNPLLWDRNMEPHLLPYLWFVWGWYDGQDEQHAIFHCTHPHTVSLRRRCESLFSEARAQDVFTFLHQNNNKLYFSALTVFFMSRLGVARFDWRPFLVNLVNLLGLKAFLVNHVSSIFPPINYLCFMSRLALSASSSRR